MGRRSRRRRLQTADRPRWRGKSGGFRTIILFKVGGHSFFVHGFAKNEKTNITPKELKALKKLAATFLGLDADGLAKASAAGEIAEVVSDG
jgi:hypothetical protein